MEIRRFKARLLARRADLLGDLHQIKDALDAPQPKDWEDRSSERQGDEVLETLGLADQHEVRRINAALARMDEGTFGVCLGCDKSIAEERLNIVPDTPLCRDCAAG